jgi:hypothetical protein
MANFFLRSADGSDADNGSTWALAKATLAGVFSACAAGDTVYVADGHSELPGAAITLTSPGTSASPVRVLCVDDTGDPASPSTLATTATIKTNSNSALIFAGYAYYYGITFTAGEATAGSAADIGFQSGVSWSIVFDSCTLETESALTGADILIGVASTGADDEQLILINTKVKFGHAGCTIRRCSVRFIWKSTLNAIDSAGTTPTVLFTTQADGTANILLEDLDLSAMGSGTSIVNVATTRPHSIMMRNCKLGASVALTTGAITGTGGAKFSAYNCDSADTNYRLFEQTYEGTTRQETTIVRTGGSAQKHNASDVTYSLKMESTANSKFWTPLFNQAPLLAFNETTGSAITATVEIVNDGATLTNEEVWLEVSYSGTTGFPIGSTASDRSADILAAPGNQTSSTVDWTTTGLTSPVKQKLEVTFTPQEQGVLSGRIMLAKASTTIYVDATMTIS